LALFDRRGLELRPDHVAHHGNPVGHDVPLLAVPLLEHHRAGALVILAGHLDGMGEALHAELLEPRLGEVEVLEPPAHLGTREGLVAVLRHRRPDRLDGEHRIHDAAVVEHLADTLLLAGTFALVVNELEEVRVHPEAGARRVERRALVALGAVARGDHVGVARRPPVTDEVVHREPDPGRLLHRHLVHDAPARQEDPVGIDAPDLEPRGLLLLTGLSTASSVSSKPRRRLSSSSVGLASLPYGLLWKMWTIFFP